MSSIYSAMQSANQFDALAVYNYFLRIMWQKEVRSKIDDINTQLKTMPNPLGVVSNPEYFTKIIQSICGTCYSFRETVESIATLQSYVDSSKTVFEKTFQTKVQEINELVSTFNTFLTV